MEPVLLKYRNNDHDYLVYDINKNHTFLDSHAVRAICSYNCGLGSTGIVAGPYEGADGKMTMKFFTPDGSEKPANREGLHTGLCYLLDAGYLSGNGRDNYEARPVGKVFLSDNLLREIFSPAARA